MNCPTWVHRFAVLTSMATWVLLCAGALVTGTGSGLAVPDWPLSYGQFFPPMVGGVLFEHGHRLIAGSVAILMMLLCGFLQWKDPRRWVRWLGIAGVIAVLMQAGLGGLTVLLGLPKQVSISHAFLAQTFFSITVVIALVTSRHWSEMQSGGKPARAPSKLLCLFITVGFFLQLVLGATVRHFKAGLAISDFPTAFGGIWPDHFDFSIAVHYAHRVGAFSLALLVAGLVILTIRKYAEHLGLTALVGGLASFVAMQILLGAVVIWARRPIPVTTLHLAIGALCLASSVAITVYVFRLHHLMGERAA